MVVVFSRSNLAINMVMNWGENLYPNCVKAVVNSPVSMELERSRSNELKVCCHADMDSHSLSNPWKSTVPPCPLSKISTIICTVTILKGVHDPLHRQACNSLAEILPLLSVSAF
eukprot:Lithocolla_globosa_v1_NODE_6770_length_1037_cov_16.720978.p2 type:complete len:114 gc:universal NODE_6770_length_1037_cov_16.720978:465-124(-)